MIPERPVGKSTLAIPIERSVQVQVSTASSMNPVPEMPQRHKGILGLSTNINDANTAMVGYGFRKKRHGHMGGQKPWGGKCLNIARLGPRLQGSPGKAQPPGDEG